MNYDLTGAPSTRPSYVTSGQVTAKVRGDALAAQALGITGTPTFLVGFVQGDGTVKIVRRVTGARPIGDFASVLEELLSSVARAQ